jgi:hypothetical protein
MMPANMGDEVIKVASTAGKRKPRSPLPFRPPRGLPNAFDLGYCDHIVNN